MLVGTLGLLSICHKTLITSKLGLQNFDFSKYGNSPALNTRANLAAHKVAVKNNAIPFKRTFAPYAKLYNHMGVRGGLAVA